MLISLIVPVYNLKAYLPETVASIVEARRALGPDASKVEVVFVDDGSTDGSGALLDAVAAEQGFQVVHKPNGGEGSARNAGVERAKGLYLTYLDGDDILLPNALTEMLARLREFPAADAFSFRFATYPDGGRRPEPVGGASRIISTTSEIPAEPILRFGVFPSVFRREAAPNLRFSALPLGADREYVLSFLARARAIVLSDALIGGYRQRTGSMAHVRWDARKICSQGDHAANALLALFASGKRLDRKGTGYLASLVVSEVPARLARLDRGDDIANAWAHWLTLVRQLPVSALSLSIRVMRRAILAVGWSRALSIGVARMGRFVGVA